MNEPSLTVLLAVGRTTILLAAAALIIGGLLGAVRPSSPGVHRTAWFLVLVVGWLFLRLPVTIPYSESSPHAVRREATEKAPRTSHREVVGGRPSDPSGPLALDHGHTAPEPAILVSDTAADVGLPAASPTEVAVHPSESPAVVSATGPWRSSVGGWRWARAMMTIWLGGMVCTVLGWLAAYVWFVLRLPRGKSAGGPDEAAWSAQWDDLLVRQGIRPTIPIRVTARLGPMLCRLPHGFCLLLPREPWGSLSPSGRLAILRHELAHYQRADTWKSLAVRLLALPHWFNPLAWWAVGKFDQAAEWACDRQAVDCRAERATDYARALVRIGELTERPPSFARAFRGHGLSVRVRRLLAFHSMKEDSMMKKMLVVAVALGLVVVCLIRIDLIPADAQPPEGQTSPRRITAAEKAVPAEAGVSSGLDMDESGSQPAGARPKEALRYDGKSFDQWRDELETELKPERRTEAIKAFAAFGAAGYGREAAEVILGVMRGYDASRMHSGPMGQLKDAAISAFRSPEIDYGDGITPFAFEDGFPVLLEELREGTRNGRLFAVMALRQMGSGSEAAVPFLVEMVKKEDDAAVLDEILRTLVPLDTKGSSAPTLLEIVCSEKPARLRRQAFWTLTAVDRSGESIAAGLRSMIGEEDAGWLQIALGSLIPKVDRHPYVDGPESIFKTPDRPGGFGGWMGGGGYGGGVETAPKRELAPKAGPVMKVLAEAIADERESVRQEAFRAVARIGPEAKGMVGDLMRLFEKAPPDKRVLIVVALAAFGSAAQEALPFLQKAAADEDERVRLVAQQAVETISAGLKSGGPMGGGFF